MPLKRDSQNARRHSTANKAAIRKSLEAVGAGRSIVIDAGDNLLAGEGVTNEWEAMGGKVRIVESDGTELIAVKRVDVAPDSAKARQLATLDNLTADTSAHQYDIDKLRAALANDPVSRAIAEQDERLRELLKTPPQAETADAGALIDKAAQLQEKWQVRRGDLWQCGKHRVMCGDSTNTEDVARLMAGEKAQLSVTSPPYGVGKSYETKGIAPWFESVRPIIKNLCMAAKVVVWNIGDLYSMGGQFIEPTFAYSVNMFGESGFKPIWIRMWLKQGMNFGVGPYHLVSNKPVQQYEYVGAFGADDGSVPEESLPDMTDFEWIIAFAGAKFKYVRRLSNEERKGWGYAGVWQMDTVRANKDHPAMFPAELPRRAILMHSDDGGIVLDPFLGSGTTLVACEQTGRIGRGMEIEPKYVAVTLERLAGMGLEPHLLQ